MMFYLPYKVPIVYTDPQLYPQKTGVWLQALFPRKLGVSPCS